MEQPFSQENCIQSGEVLFLDIIMAKTYIENDVMINLISSGLNGTELSVVLFLIRKTNGWHKETDEISLSQFLKHIPVTKPTLCKAIKNLQLVKIIKLVKKGKSLKSSNEYKLEKNISNWQLVKKAKLVKFTKRTSKDFDNQLVKKPLHTKETITKETITKETLPEKASNVTVTSHNETEEKRIDKKKKRTIPAKAENAGTKQFIDQWYKKFRDTFGQKYNVEGAKDGSLIKKLLDKYSYQELIELAERFFDSKDKFIQDSGYTIGVFNSQINKLLIKQNPLTETEKVEQMLKRRENGS